jgi:hypothetical protein
LIGIRGSRKAPPDPDPDRDTDTCDRIESFFDRPEKEVATAVSASCIFSTDMGNYQMR